MTWLPTAAEWTAFWTFVLAGSALFALWYAKGQLDEIRQQRNEAREHARAGNRAYVVVSPEADFKTQALYLRIENTGRVAAEKVHIGFEEPLETTDDSLDLDQGALWNPSILPPGYSYRTAIDRASRQDAGLPLSFWCHVQWMSKSTDAYEVFSERYLIDFERFYKIRDWTPQPDAPYLQLLNRIAGTLENIGHAVATLRREDKEHD